jgi:SMC interacting uncharacterized protein involved in chromosome segregation
MADLKVRYPFQMSGSRSDDLRPCQNKLEAQYAAKREAHLGEVSDLKQQLEMKANEVRSLNASIDSLKSVNEELKVCISYCSVSELNINDPVLVTHRSVHSP